MAWKRFSTLAVLVSVVLTCRAHAADSAGPYRVDVGLGAVVWGSGVTVHRDRQRLSASGAPGAAASLGLGYAIGKHFDLVVDGSVTASDLFDTVEFGSVAGGARYYPLGRDVRVRPWLIAETGWYETSVARTDLLSGGSSRVSEAGAGFAAGAGLDVPLGRHFSIGPDVRFQQVLGAFDDPHLVVAMVRTSFHFGGTPHAN